MAVETSLSKGTDDRDSGVESQGPSTPLKKNCECNTYWEIAVPQG